MPSSLGTEVAGTQCMSFFRTAPGFLVVLAPRSRPCNHVTDAMTRLAVKECGGVSRETFDACTNTVVAFLHADLPEAVPAVDLLYHLFKQQAGLLDEARRGRERDNPATDEDVMPFWHEFAMPILYSFAVLCKDFSRAEVQISAMILLQRALLDHEVDAFLPKEAWRECMYKIVFPLLEDVLSTDVSSGKDFERRRLRASMLLSKVFLQHMHILSALPDFDDIWLTVLHLMLRFLQVASTDVLLDAVPESLKNVINVMTATGVMSPPASVTAGGTPTPQPNTTLPSSPSSEPAPPSLGSEAAEGATSSQSASKTGSSQPASAAQLQEQHPSEASLRSASVAASLWARTIAEISKVSKTLAEEITTSHATPTCPSPTTSSPIPSSSALATDKPSHALPSPSPHASPAMSAASSSPVPDTPGHESSTSAP
eukprot:Rmarinus@m.16882